MEQRVQPAEDSIPNVLVVTMERPVISDELDSPRAAAFATWCAVHLELLLLVFSSGPRQAFLQDLFQRLRMLPADGGLTAARELKAEIDEAPEASCDDSNSPTYYAMRALSVASYAADAWNASDPAECARWASEECLELIRDLEIGSGDRTESVASLEADAQRDVLARLEVSELGTLPRGEEDALLAARLAELAATYARARGWNP